MTQRVELTTARLIIRTPDEYDVQDIFSLMNDLEIAANTGFRPMTTPSEAEGKIRRGMANLQLFGIAEKEHPMRIIGIFEVSPHKMNTAKGEKCNYEICYFLHKEARKKGYMTEVMEKMKTYLFTERMADSLTIAVYPRNDASRRVALKSGFTYERLEKKCGVTFQDELADLEYYTLDKEEYADPDKKSTKNVLILQRNRNGLTTGAYSIPSPAMPPCSHARKAGYSAFMRTP